MTFHDDEHKINNTGWICNDDEREGWNEAKPKRECQTFFQSTFSRSEMKRRSRICTCKTERTLQISGKCVQFTQSCLTDSTVLFCARKARQKNQCNEASRPLKSSALSQHRIWRSLLTIWIYYTAAKTTTSLWNEMKGKTRKMQSD